MSQQVEQMTPEAALLWLAGLERPCSACGGKGYQVTHRTVPGKCEGCAGSGKVPVLDLREICGNGNIYAHFSTDECAEKGCPGWLPKQGRDALHEAMSKDGWYYSIYQEDIRTVVFWRWMEIRPPILIKVHGSDSDDWIAAVKAMKTAGHRGET